MGFSEAATEHSVGQSLSQYLLVTVMVQFRCDLSFLRSRNVVPLCMSLESGIFDYSKLMCFMFLTENSCSPTFRVNMSKFKHVKILHDVWPPLAVAAVAPWLLWRKQWSYSVWEHTEEHVFPKKMLKKDEEKWATVISHIRDSHRPLCGLALAPMRLFKRLILSPLPAAFYCKHIVEKQHVFCVYRWHY